jgi:hypothetical protein
LKVFSRRNPSKLHTIDKDEETNDAAATMWRASQ